MGTGAAKGAGGLRAFNRIGCLGLIALALALPVIGYFEAVREAEADLAALKKQLAAEGILVPIEQLIPEVPKGEKNAADLYQQAFRSLQPLEQQLDSLAGLPSESPERIRLTRQFVAQRPEGLLLLDEASRVSYCAFPVKWSASFGPSGHHSRLRHAGRCVSQHIDVLVADGNLDAALDSVATLLRMARHVDAEPTMFAQLGAGWFLEKLAIGSATRTLAAGSASRAACHRLFEEIGRVDNRGDYARALRGDLANTVRERVFEDLARGKGRIEDLAGALAASDKMLAWSSRPLRRFVFARDEIIYLSAIAACIRITDSGTTDAVRETLATLDAVRAAHQLESMASRSLLFIAGGEAPPRLLTAIHCDTLTASLRAAQVALAAVAFAAEQGRYPSSLAELRAGGWKLPRDPFGGGELRYRREKRGFVVYSLGPNMADDSATEYDSQTMSLADGPYDIVLRVKR